MLHLHLWWHYCIALFSDRMNHDWLWWVFVWYIALWWVLVTNKKHFTFLCLLFALFLWLCPWTLFPDPWARKEPGPKLGLRILILNFWVLRRVVFVERPTWFCLNKDISNGKLIIEKKIQFWILYNNKNLIAWRKNRRNKVLSTLSETRKSVHDTICNVHLYVYMYIYIYMFTY